MRLPIGHLVYGESSRLVHSGPCLLTAVVLSGRGGAGYIKVYDGHNNTGELKLLVNSADDATRDVELPVPADFDEGLYVEIEGQTDVSWTVQYLPLLGGWPA